MPQRFRPDPDEQVALVPPGREPPTAIGVATPPPPEPVDRWRAADRPSLVARIAMAELGCLLGAAGLAAGTVLPFGPLVGAGLVLTGGSTICRAVTGRGMVPWLRSLVSRAHRGDRQRRAA